MTAVNPEQDGSALLKEARQCLERAYAPYSQFPVAAAVVDEHGRVFTGINIENVSYGLTMCAERVAIFTAIAAGAHRINAVALTAEKMKLVTPCGACRQVMAEFCHPETPVFLDTGTAVPRTTTVGDLLPDAFTQDNLNQPFPVSQASTAG
ncbi:MAG: cytidine deaminase [Hydrogenophilales bacterium 28-61-23]|nr:MAG: cytidine deaminase [Hydrogenophilales bacterium 28-61-23]